MLELESSRSWVAASPAALVLLVACRSNDSSPVVAEPASAAPIAEATPKETATAAASAASTWRACTRVIPDPFWADDKTPAAQPGAGFLLEMEVGVPWFHHFVRVDAEGRTDLYEGPDMDVNPFGPWRHARVHLTASDLSEVKSEIEQSRLQKAPYSSSRPTTKDGVSVMLLTRIGGREKLTGAYACEVPALERVNELVKAKTQAKNPSFSEFKGNQRELGIDPRARRKYERATARK